MCNERAWKNTIPLCGPVLALAMLGIPSIGHASDFDSSRSVAKTLPLTSGSLTIEHRQGNIRIRTHAMPNVDVTATIRTSTSTSQEEADDLAKRIQVVIEGGADGVRIRTEYPEIHKTSLFGAQFSYSVDYDIVMPATAPLELSNLFGDTSIDGLHADGDVTNGQGQLVFRNGHGRQKLRSSFGTIEVDRNDGSVDVEGSNGAISIRRISGSAKVRDHFGAIDVSDVGGHADLGTTFGAISFSGVAKGVECQASHSKIDGHGVKGTVTIRNTFGKVELRNIDGSVEVENQNAGVTVADIGGNARIGSRFGLVTATDVRGSLTVHGSNGGIEASSIEGGANLETSLGPVVLAGVGGPVEVLNRNGSITVDGLAGSQCQKIRLNSTFGSIRVGLPSGSSWDVDATTSFGQVSSELPIAVRAETGKQSLDGRIGNGGCPLVIRNQNGSIEIVKG